MVFIVVFSLVFLIISLDGAAMIFFYKIWFLLRDFYLVFFGGEEEWIEKATGWNQTFITALTAQFQQVFNGLPINWTVDSYKSFIADKVIQPARWER